MWDHLARDPLRGLVVAQERSGTLGGGLDVVAVRGEAAPAPQAHRTAPYRPRYSLDQRTAGQYLGRLGTPVTECTCSAAEHPEGTPEVQVRAPLPAWPRAWPADPVMSDPRSTVTSFHHPASSVWQGAGTRQWLKPREPLLRCASTYLSIVTTKGHHVSPSGRRAPSPLPPPTPITPPSRSARPESKPAKLARHNR